MINKSGLEPLGVAVLILPDPTEEVTQGGIVLPKETKERGDMAETKATVIAVGPWAWHDEPTPRAKPGDRVLFAKYAGKLCEGPLDGVMYRAVNDRDIFLKLVGENDGK